MSSQTIDAENFRPTRTDMHSHLVELQVPASSYSPLTGEKSINNVSIFVCKPIFAISIWTTYFET